MARPKNAVQDDLNQTISSVVPSGRATLGDVAYISLKSAILTTKLTPGLHVSEQGLSDAIGMSRTPVREATRRLAEEGLVEVVAQLGTRIARINLPKLREAIFVRRSIECSAIDSISRIDRASRKILEEDLEKHENARTEDLLSLCREDDRFHKHLMEACNLGMAYTATKSISHDMTRIMFLMGVDRSYFNNVFKEHGDIVRLLAYDNDVQAARQLLYKHLSGFAIDVAEIMRSKSGFVEDD